MSEQILCLGEALVDLIRERADTFVAHFGGAEANVAVFAARAGAAVMFAGSAGDDEFGHWLRDRLEREGVATDLFELRPGHQTPVALVHVGDDGEARYRRYGGADGALPGDRVAAAVPGAAALFFSTNALIGAEQRELTMRARALALEQDLPILFDAKLRLHRWPSRAQAAASANACVRGALLVRCNLAEAEVMTGEADPERAAVALVKAGARMVVITLGPDGAMLRGELRADVPGVRADVLSTIGAGDALTGVLLAKLAAAGFYPPAAAAALREAVEASARACERWGALD